MSDRPDGSEARGRPDNGRDRTEAVLEEALPEEHQRQDQLDDDPDKRPEAEKPAPKRP